MEPNRSFSAPVLRGFDFRVYYRTDSGREIGEIPTVEELLRNDKLRESNQEMIALNE